MNIEFELERYLEKIGVDYEKVPEDIFSTIVSRIEEDIDDYMSDKFDIIAKEWVWLEIEQDLDEHPEWKIKQKIKGDDDGK